VLSVEDWAEIRRLAFAEQMGTKAIARQLGVARNTVRTAIRSDSPPKYEREQKPSAVDEFEPQIRALLRDCPTIPATVIAERIGWSRGITILKERVAELRPLYQPPKPYQRTDYQPGELAQWDLWQPPVDIPVGLEAVQRLWVVTGLSGYSRTSMGHMIPTRETHDVLAGHLECLKDLGAVPRQGIYDGEGAIGRNRAGKQEFTQAFSMFKGTLGMSAYILRGGFPEGKGALERTHDYFERSFLPGRRFKDPSDFNFQFKSWLRVTANHRIHATLHCRPDARLAEDKAAMLRLPPILPDVRFHHSLLLGRDHYVRYGTCDYSVHPKAIGRRVQIAVDLESVVVTCQGEQVANHRRSLVGHRTITDPVHGRARRLIKSQAQEDRQPTDQQVAEPDLNIYDALTGGL
jgi:transposase